jgi:transposase
MKYTLEQRLDIGRRIYEGEITKFQAVMEYGINDGTARNYMWLYRDTNNLPHKKSGRKKSSESHIHSPSIEAKQPDLETYEAMTKEELIQALVQARITETRLKKGYEVKGDGSIIQYSNKNTK